ncbi:DUF4291 domain-containing protein [Streptomyces asoensis]|uniref:DUF4291 domain-containing protein n=1 Tax=Streptomyces asoensis TaxID=249586 RepID=A0A6M4X3F0_9ACTN|nr:DUF4291 domain-containing protein [Streptomyces asoensis]
MSASNDRPVEQEPKFRIRATHSESTITVYQAYHPRIGNAAARNGRFPSTWSRERMTWIIKPRDELDEEGSSGRAAGL